MDNAVNEYIDQADDARKELFQKLQALIFIVKPDIEIKMSYGVPKYYCGRGFIYLGYWKQGVSIYPGKLVELESFRLKYPKIKTRIGTINIKLTDEIPWNELEEIIKIALHRS